MTAFDPFASTLSEATAQTGPMAFARWGNAQLLLARREHFEADPLAGVYLCAQHGLPMPDWLADAYCRAYERVMCAEVASWGEAFGEPWPKGTQLRRVQIRNQRRGRIFRDVLAALVADPSTALDDALFERIGITNDVGKTLAKELYAEAVRQFGYGGARTKAAMRKAASFGKLAAMKRKR